MKVFFHLLDVMNFSQAEKWFLKSSSMLVARFSSASPARRSQSIHLLLWFSPHAQQEHQNRGHGEAIFGDTSEIWRSGMDFLLKGLSW